MISGHVREEAAHQRPQRGREFLHEPALFRESHDA